MSTVTPTRKLQGPRALRFQSAWLILLLLVPSLIGLAVYRFLSASEAKITVWGLLSPHDVDEIRGGVAHWRYKELGDGISHLRWGIVWDEVRLLRSCPLESIVSKDGRTGFATCHGRIWNGNYRSITYMFTNNAGVWSGTTRASSEGSK